MNSGFESHSNLQIHHHQNGIKLVQPNKLSSQPNIQELFSLPLQFYFYDMNHAFCYTNQKAAEINGFTSEKDAVGRTIHHVAAPESANRIIANNQMVLNHQSMQIIEESILRKDDIFLEGISIKFPWYHQKKLVGLFGCSFVIDSMQTLAKNLILLTQTGLLHPAAYPIKQTENKFYFSKREKDILYHLTRGKTAREIASVLGLSKRTVEHYLENTKIKTHSASKSELIEKVFGMFQ